MVITTSCYLIKSKARYGLFLFDNVLHFTSMLELHILAYHYTSQFKTMKKALLLIAIITSTNCLAQRKTTENLIFEKDTISFERLDYSKHGLAQIFISMYEEKIDARLTVENQALRCLKKGQNIYHTYYYFIPLRKEYSLTHKQQILFAFLQQINSNPDVDKADIYLNLDGDYATNYIQYLSSKNEVEKIKRSILTIDAVTICNGLSIER